MSNNFSHTEELPGMHIQNSTGHIKATKAGMFLDSEISCCGGFVKTFIPWGSMVTMAYRRRTCCKKAGFLIGDRLQTPVNIGVVSQEDFEEVRRIFSETVAEVGNAPPGEANTPAGHGMTLSQDGIYHVRKCCGMRRLFIPWAKIDGLVMSMGTCGCSCAKLHLITEAGHEFRVLKTGNKKLLWEKFDDIHKLKYGTSDSGGSKLRFNVNTKDDRKTCVLTNQSLRLCSGNGRRIEEVDLERVVGVRASKKKGKNAIDIALSVGQGNKCSVLSIPLEDEQAGDVAKQIRQRATERKNRLQRTTGLIA